MDRILPVTMVLRSCQMPWRKWTVLAASEKCNSTRTMPTTWAGVKHGCSGNAPFEPEDEDGSQDDVDSYRERRVEPMAFLGWPVALITHD